MELFTPETLKTMAGAVLAVTLTTAVLKAIIPLTGRVTQAVAFALSLSLALIFGVHGTIQQFITCIFNGAVIFSASMGADQLVNYNGRTK